MLLPLICAAMAGAATGALASHVRARRARRDAQRRLLQAVVFAAERHRDQRRKNPMSHPYINHPVRVAGRLCGAVPREGGGEAVPDVDDVDVLIAALLHDTVEDTDTTLAEICDQFGPRVARLVDEVSDDKTLPRADRKRLQIEHAAGASYGAKLVKLADKLDNLSDLLVITPKGWSGQRVTEYFEWSDKVIAGLRGTDSAMETQLDAIFERVHVAVDIAEKQAANST